jgi:hypothetical protein
VLGQGRGAGLQGGFGVVRRPDLLLASQPSGETLSIFAWSPDNTWLVVRQRQGPALIEVATGFTLPLGYTAGTIPTSMK